ncbi:uncharacterized protein B0P05DRAFT_635650 [Gilbertella persicaria]|uniref:uncharacterized protein n=1 Tax=Gilbertella persicaria TaxID=101096 RepID=UPI00222096B2|nr:uncharacterized protein B0P05DRAFT_635650 [Gilbertella persicaria]KAI8086967.1 hypothetical protein B0P05DRAFT_635650 [Gilbertella persicaria]
MSFKSKQRAKHGHLFGDDPLSAALVSSSDDPLLTNSSQSSRTSSPQDPLSRPDSSNSTPVFGRKTNGIFGDIDVSKLSNKRNTSLRSNTLKKHYDIEDEEDLFGGGRKKTSSKTSSVHKKSPVLAVNDHLVDIPPVNNSYSQPTLPVKDDREPKAVETKIEPKVELKVEPKAVETRIEPRVEPKAEEQKPKVEPPQTKQSLSTSSTSSSSFFRFFKSNNNNPKPASPSPSVKSIQTSPPVAAVVVNKVNDPIEQPSPAPISKPNLKKKPEPEPEPKPEPEPEPTVVIEDEATRAFADDVMTFKPKPAQYFDVTPELSMDALRIEDNTANKRLVPSVSTPTHSVDDPWSQIVQLEPSVSSPLVVKVQDIEPQKRTAFADLITSWNTGQSNRIEEEQEDEDGFFDHVAEERRDIGFAGIGQKEDTHSTHDMMRPMDWDNPWDE